MTQIPIKLEKESVVNKDKADEQLKAATVWQNTGCRGTLEICTGV